jgi:hypothetical protein
MEQETVDVTGSFFIEHERRQFDALIETCPIFLLLYRIVEVTMRDIDAQGFLPEEVLAVWRAAKTVMALRLDDVKEARNWLATRRLDHVSLEERNEFFKLGSDFQKADEVFRKRLCAVDRRVEQLVNPW